MGGFFAFEGGEVSDVITHAFGVRWGKAADGRLLYQEPGAATWTVYEHGTTTYVPPSGYRVAAPH